MQIAPDIQSVLIEDERLRNEMFAPFNPITGVGSILDRERLDISDFPIASQQVPSSMMSVPLIQHIAEAGSIKAYVHQSFKDAEGNVVEFSEEVLHTFIEQITRIRSEHDFCFWAAFLVYIKNKGGGEDVLFRLNRPQRRLVSKFERMRLDGVPIRIIILKARQWGGSTCTQLYFAWLQLVHKVGLNSLIIAQVKDTANEIKDMFDRMLKNYPAGMLHEIGDAFNENEKKMEGVGNNGNTHRVPQRNCKIKIGSAENPDSCRGGDYNLVHCSEVGLWKKTEGKTPEAIVRSACSGIMLAPYTMIVYESTANGVGNFFHREYVDAKERRSQFDTIFVPWFEIEMYRKTFTSEAERIEFAKELIAQKDNDNAADERHEPGKYLWWLFTKGASLEGINWYISERTKYHDHADMASEYPSDDVEAFAHSGANVFDKYHVEEMRKTCKQPAFMGELAAVGDEGASALSGLTFTPDAHGMLWIWKHPEIDPDERIVNRYLTVVDIGGRTKKADWSVIVVFDRVFMMSGGKPVVVAQWYGHTDIDLLAWKAVQVAAYYDNSLLVIESNTIETHDKERHIEGGDQSLFILNQIKDVYGNLYARKSGDSDSVDEGNEVKYGFHTNTKTKPEVISMLIKAVRKGMYIERDSRCCDEFDTYERKQNGAYGAIIGAHDDLLMTRAIGMRICFDEMDMPFAAPRKNAYAIAKSKAQVTEAVI